MTAPTVSLRASSLERVALCPGSAVLPGVQRITAAATRGTGIHSFLEAVALSGRDAALDAIEDESLRAAASAIPLALLPTAVGEAWEHEIALALNPATGAFLTPETLPGGGYDVPPGFIAGRTDALRFDASTSTVYVVDWKTGREVAPAASNYQLRFYAVAAARKHGATRAVVLIVYLWGDRVRTDRAEFDSLALDAAEHELGEILRRVDRQDIAAPEIALGAHCRYCPALSNCPARLAEIRAISSNPGSAISPAESLTPAAAGLAWERIRLIRSALDAAEDAIKVFAESSPIHLPNGKILAWVEASRESLDGLLVRSTVSELLGKEAAELAAPVEYSATKTSLRAAVKSALKTGEKIGAKLDSVLAALADAGAIKTSFYFKATELAPDELAIDAAGIARKAGAK